jgi:hypothetical protein
MAFTHAIPPADSNFLGRGPLTNIHHLFPEPVWAVGARLDSYIRSDGGLVPGVACLISQSGKTPRFGGEVKPLSIKRIEGNIFVDNFSRYI